MTLNNYLDIFFMAWGLVTAGVIIQAFRAGGW